MTTIATLTKGETFTAKGGKFDGRTGTVVAQGTTGRTTMVEWADNGARGTVLATTEVE